MVQKQTVMSTEHFQTFTEHIAVLSFAVYGGVAHTFLSIRGKKRKPSWLKALGLLLVNSLVAGFAGLMALMVAESAGFALPQTNLLVGMAGFMGGKFLELIELKIMEKLDTQ